MTTDIAALKQRINLADLIGRDTPLVRIAGTRGGEWAGPCPFCGGQDRLHVQPAYGGGRWFCRQCAPRGGDAIDYLRRRERLTFHEALSRLAVLTPTAQPAFQTSYRGRPQTPAWREPRWQRAAQAEVRQAAWRPGSRSGGRSGPRLPDRPGPRPADLAGVGAGLHAGLAPAAQGQAAGDHAALASGRRAASRAVPLHPPGAGEAGTLQPAQRRGAAAVRAGPAHGPRHPGARRRGAQRRLALASPARAGRRALVRQPGGAGPAAHAAACCRAWSRRTAGSSSGWTISPARRPPCQPSPRPPAMPSGRRAAWTPTTACRTARWRPGSRRTGCRSRAEAPRDALSDPLSDTVPLDTSNSPARQGGAWLPTGSPHTSCACLRWRHRPSHRQEFSCTPPHAQTSPSRPS